MTAPAWTCDCCGEPMPPELAGTAHFPRCPACGWPCDPPAPALTAREAKARQAVLAAGELDTWRAKFLQYHTTADSCSCPDAVFRHVTCKHQLALRLLADPPAPGCQPERFSGNGDAGDRLPGATGHSHTQTVGGAG